VAVLARAEETSQGTLSGPPPPTQQQGWCPKPPFRLRGMYGGLGTPSPPLGALSHPGPGTPPGDRVNPDPSAYIRYGGMR